MESEWIRGMLKNGKQNPTMSSPTYEARRVLGAPGSEQAGPARQTMGLRLQIGGFILIIALLGLDAYVGFHGAAAIRRQLAASDESQSPNAAPTNEALQAQNTERKSRACGKRRICGTADG